MSKKYLVSMGALALVASAIDASDASNKTTFIVRAPFQSSMPEKLTGFRDRAGVRCDGNDGAFQIVAFGGRSTKASDLGEYFGISGKSDLVVAGNQAFTNPNLDQNPYQRDVNALQFNIQNNYVGSTTGINQTFKSTLKLRPRQSFYGIGLDYRQYVGCERKWWFEASAPILHVKNNMNLEEEVISEITPITGANANMIEAFKGEKGFVNQDNLTGTPGVPTVTGQAWKYGKIDGSQKKTGVADIELKVGYDYLREETYHLGNWAGLVIPTGNKINGEFVFEAQVPRGHFGFMLGTTAGFEIWCGCDSTLRWELDANSRYLLSNTQTRSFDVKNKPWSRYMLVFSDFTSANTPDFAVTEGINIFTRQVKVKPRFEYNMNTAFVYDYCKFTGEVGYNFWARQSETVTLNSPWVEGPAFADIDNTNGFVAGRINRAIQVGEDFSAAGTTPPNADAYGRLAIKETDLDLDSAAHPCAISNTLYAYVGYDYDACCWPMHFGLGGSYEFSGENTALNRWNIWGKLVLSI